jgi:hypothetical protein
VIDHKPPPSTTEEAVFWFAIVAIALLITLMSIVAGVVISRRGPRPRDPEDVPMLGPGD